MGRSEWVDFYYKKRFALAKEEVSVQNSNSRKRLIPIGNMGVDSIGRMGSVAKIAAIEHLRCNKI